MTNKLMDQPEGGLLPLPARLRG